MTDRIPTRELMMMVLLHKQEAALQVGPELGRAGVVRDFESILVKARQPNRNRGEVDGGWPGEVAPTPIQIFHLVCVCFF